jgi:hypothetical protein
MKSEYDLCTAITFLLVGLGIGSALVIVLKPSQRDELEGIRGIRSWRISRTQPQEKEKERIA